MITTAIKQAQLMDLIIAFNDEGGLSDSDLSTFQAMYSDLTDYGKEMIEMDCEINDYALPPLN